jgi:hypothetical protein
MATDQPPGPAPLRIFLNYRREDTAGYAGRLYDALVSRFPADQVFIDIDAIEPGVDFVEVVENAVGACDVFIALIGQRWVEVMNERGERRLGDEYDFVRLEIGRGRQESPSVLSLSTGWRAPDRRSVWPWPGTVMRTASTAPRGRARSGPTLARR